MMLLVETALLALRFDIVGLRDRRPFRPLLVEHRAKFGRCRAAGKEPEISEAPVRFGLA
jgi:hypothetical protein